MFGGVFRRGSKSDSVDRGGKLVKSDSESGTEMGLSGGGGGQRGLGTASSIDSMDLFKSAKSSHPSDTESSTGRKKGKKKAVQKVGLIYNTSFAMRNDGRFVNTKNFGLKSTKTLPNSKGPLRARL